MADVDVTATPEAITVTDVPTAPAISTMSVNPSIVDAVGVADVVSTAPAFTLKLYRGTNSVTVSAITEDWEFVETYKQFRNLGIKLKGIILVPGSGTDVFVIKDGGESGALLYNAAHATTVCTVVVYPGTYVKPFIDFSLCTLTAGHSITFLW